MSALVAVENWLPPAWRMRLLKPLWPHLSAFQNEVAVFVVLPALTNAPVILILGLLTGYVLAKVRYPRPILYAMLIWPAWAYVHYAWLSTAQERAVAAGETRSRQETTLALYFIQYTLLLLVTYLTYLLTKRAVRRTDQKRGIDSHRHAHD